MGYGLILDGWSAKIPTVMDNAEIVVSQSTMADLQAWRHLASEVEREFGAPMADSDEWNTQLWRHIDRGTAWCARPDSEVPIVGGMWLSYSHPDAVTISWPAVRREHRRRGIGRALVEEDPKPCSGVIVRRQISCYLHGESDRRRTVALKGARWS